MHVKTNHTPNKRMPARCTPPCGYGLLRTCALPAESWSMHQAHINKRASILYYAMHSSGTKLDAKQSVYLHAAPSTRADVGWSCLGL